MVVKNFPDKDTVPSGTGRWEGSLGTIPLQVPGNEGGDSSSLIDDLGLDGIEIKRFTQGEMDLVIFRGRPCREGC